MNLQKLSRFSFGSIILGLLLITGGSHALAAGEYIQIQNVSPLGAISPGNTINFSVAATGFSDAKYALSDSFSATGMTSGTIDKAGFFSWTPGIYDAGRHTLMVTATDILSHIATTTVNIIVTGNSVLVTALTPGQTVALHRPITFTMFAPGFVSPSFSVYDSYSVSTLSSNSTVSSSGAFSWTPSTADDLGTHSFSVRAWDIYGHSAQTVQTITVINPSVSILSLLPGTSAGVGSQVSFASKVTALTSPTFLINDSFVGTSTVTASTLNATGVFSWKPTTADLGLHALTVTATDSSGNAASTTASILITSAPATSATVAPASFTGTPQANTTSTSPSTSATKKYLFTTTLTVGSKGTAVTELQKRLTMLGFFSGPTSNYFGALTAASVRKFQKAQGLAPVGFTGPATRAALNKN